MPLWSHSRRAGGVAQHRGLLTQKKSKIPKELNPARTLRVPRHRAAAQPPGPSVSGSSLLLLLASRPPVASISQPPRSADSREIKALLHIHQTAVRRRVGVPISSAAIGGEGRNAGRRGGVCWGCLLVSQACWPSFLCFPFVVSRHT